MVTRKVTLVGSVAAVALLVQGIAANATIMTTAPETEIFGLTAPQASFQVTNNSQNTPVVANTNSGPQSPTPAVLNFNQFNSGLGTLLSVSVSFLSAYTSTSVLNVQSGPFGQDLPGPINFFADGTFGLLLSGAGLIANQSSTQTANATCAIAYALGENEQIKQCNNTATNNGSFNGTTSGLSLAPFIGNSTFDLSAALTSALLPRVNPDNATNLAGFADNSTFNGTLADGWTGSVSVVYTFDAPTGAVPEPLTLYLLLAGLGGAALLPRRRR